MPRAPKALAVPPLSPGALTLWASLLDRADTFRKLAPWEFISGTSLLGVRDPVSGDVDWCSIMGQNRECFGVAIYPGDAGFASRARMLETGPDEFDAILQQYAWVLTFNDRTDVTKDMATVLKAVRRRYRGSFAWPELLIHDPGYFPMPPRDEATLRRTVNVLDSLTAMCAMAQGEPGWYDADIKGLPWVASMDGTGKAIFARHPLPRPAPPPAPPILPLDDVAIGRVLQKGTRMSEPLLVDWFPGDAVIDGPEAGGRPYYIMHPMIINAQGMVVATDVSRYSTIWPDVAKMVLKFCEKAGVPQQLFVRRVEAVGVLRPLAKRLGCRVVHRPETAEMVGIIRDGLMAAMGGG